jgi:hypothetical protein
LVAHLNGCLEVVERKIQDGLHHYIDEALKHPAANETSREGINLKEVQGPSATLIPNETFIPFNLEPMRVELLHEPMGSLSGEQYTFRTVSLSVVKSKIQTELNGNELTVHLRNDIRSSRDVKSLTPKAKSRLQRFFQLLRNWFAAPFFKPLPDQDDHPAD